MTLYLAERLFQAIEEKNVSDVKSCLSEGANPNLLLPKYGVTPFHLAVGLSMKMEVVKMLLENNGNPNVRDSDGVTLCHVAATWDNVECLQLLYKNGAKLLAKDKYDQDALWYAKDNNSKQCVRYLEDLIANKVDNIPMLRSPAFENNVSIRKRRAFKSPITPKYLNQDTEKHQSTITTSPCLKTNSGIIGFSPKIASGIKEKFDVDQSDKFSQDEKCGANKCNTTPAEVSRYIDKDTFPEDKENNKPEYNRLNLTNGDPDLREFLKNCVAMNNKSYSSNMGLDASSPDNCVIFRKSSSSTSSSSTQNISINNDTTVWRSCTDSICDKNEPDSVFKTECGKESTDALKTTGTPKSADDSIEYRKRLLFSTKPDYYFKNQISENTNAKTIAPIDLNNIHQIEAEISDDFTLSDSTLPLSSTNLEKNDSSLQNEKKGDITKLSSTPKSSSFCDDGIMVKVLTPKDEAVNLIDFDKTLAMAKKPTQSLSSTDSNSVRNRNLNWSEISENSVCDVLTNEEGVALVEEQKSFLDPPSMKRLSNSLLQQSCLQLSSNSILGSNEDRDSSTIIYDWKELLGKPEELSPEQQHNTDTNCDSELDNLTDKEIRHMLLRYGYHPGPIAAFRAGYIRKLQTFIKAGDISTIATTKTTLADVKITTTSTTSKTVSAATTTRTSTSPTSSRTACATPNDAFTTIYSEGLASVLSGKSLPDTVVKDDQCLRRQFDLDDPNVKWREGTLKNNFNYILLDPRKLNNLCDRKATELQSFTEFISAIFYIGKGKQSRPYAHFYEALQKKIEMQNNTCSKVSMIQDIWSCDMGVVALHVFHSIIACEAYTREAAMLDAINIKNLTNQKAGDYYGNASNWQPIRRQQYGTFLLMKALKVYLVEGERQIKPANLQLKKKWPKNAHI